MSPLGDTPYQFRGGQEDLKRLFYSDPNRAFAKPITIPAGYGVVKAGSIMGIITEAAAGRLGNYVPYVPFDTVGMGAGLDNVPGLAYLTAAPSAGTEAQVTLEDSYKFAVSDHLTSSDDDQGNQDLGAISAIDRTTYSHIAAITVGSAFDSETLAKGAAITIQSATGSPYVKAQGVLKGSVDTGVGEHAKGGQGVIVLSNAMLYVDSLYNYNADVLTDLSAKVDGKYLII